MNDGSRFAVGLWTIVPTPPPRHIERTTARIALILGPLLGAAIGAVGVGVDLLVMWASGHHRQGNVIAAVCCVGAMAVASRALHWDGLADTADGFGSGRRGADALTIMSKSDIGPFGVLTLVLVALLEIFAITGLSDEGSAIWLVAIAAATGRLAAAYAAAEGTAPAKPEGLGALVIGAVRRTDLIVMTIVVMACAAAVGTTIPVDGQSSWKAPAIVLGAIIVALLAAVGLRRWATTRFGGVTGDVLGACVETATVLTLAITSLRLVV